MCIYLSPKIKWSRQKIGTFAAHSIIRLEATWSFLRSLWNPPACCRSLTVQEVYLMKDCNFNSCSTMHSLACAPTHCRTLNLQVHHMIWETILYCAPEVIVFSMLMYKYTNSTFKRKTITQKKGAYLFPVSPAIIGYIVSILCYSSNCCFIPSILANQTCCNEMKWKILKIRLSRQKQW